MAGKGGEDGDEGDGDGRHTQIRIRAKRPKLTQPRDQSMLCSFPPWLRILARRPADTRCVSTRARNLSGRYWELARLLPASGRRHVLDHEATKAAIVDQTGLKATTDRPKPPEPDECCMSGCAVCVYDLYFSSLDDYKKEARTARGRLRELSIPMHEWPEDLQKQEMKEVTASNEEEKEDWITWISIRHESIPDT
ncbi:Oxidoreductase-like protein, N-terminal [Rhizoctonia solani]|uniref:Oxidoreductase-like protein, N-terminal n=1 Tax=Rhizoctonia solani TaxID=456999 RepID=A0A8H7IN68_9AGAM|nr:Oxidoreductase-like protein, N-terminal [Rhizoctonia solani]